ncbi:FxDxF family PEP-CTERM protein [Massilia sp. METH4]|uniref:FxDxF family PEP-CTERM protein n=1 Tax=Massilia sp. METH4 TaxID=3123041 RepID=UPI0030D22AF9
MNTATFFTDITFTGATLNGVDVPFYNVWPFSSVLFKDVDVTGPLTLVVNGTVTTRFGGTASYGGMFSVTSAVPEPATYGMLAGGLAVLAFAARRRNR